MAQQTIQATENVGDSLTKIVAMFTELYAHGASQANPHAVTKAQVGLANAENTADADKPISTLTAAALAAKAPLDSPALTGTPTAPTAAGGTNTTQVATTAFVAAALANLVNAAPGALDTLNELAAALGDDANFAATMTTALAAKVDIATGVAVVEHGSDASAARPAGVAVALWYGTVEPTNAADNDHWYDTTEA